MKLQFLVCLSFALVLATVQADEFGEIPEIPKEYDVEQTEKSETENVQLADSGEKPKSKKEQYIVEDYQTKTTSLVDSDEEAHKLKAGFCHYGISAYFKKGYQIKCGCLKCTCTGLAGRWVCDYNFAYCPYYYCGNRIYDPTKQLCCCGKVYTKRNYYSCCGYFYYYTKTAKCCSYYTVKPLKANCPKSSIKG